VTNDCADAIANSDTITRDKEIVFFMDYATTNEYEMQYVEFEQTMTIDHSTVPSDCQVSYKLYVDDGSSNWVEWSALRETMQGEITFPLSTYIHFDRWNAYLSIEISNRDYEQFKTSRFSAGVQFKVVPIVHGSDVQGAANVETTSSFALFKVVFIEAAVAESCMDNALTLMEVTYSNTQRLSIDDYEI
jgi:hypothetical protein